VIIIVGGGITGLAAAFELEARGIPFQLLEATSRIGGLIHTDHVEGFTIEAGADSLLAQKPSGLELCEALGLGPRLLSTNVPRTAFVLERGRLHALPPASVLGIPTSWRGLSAYSLLPWSARARLAMEPLVPARQTTDESVAAFFRRRFGRATVDRIAGPLLGGIHAGDVEALSIRSLFPRFADSEARGESILRTFRHTHRAPSGDGLFRAPAAGMSEIVLAIERRLPAGSILRDSPAAAIDRADPGWRVKATSRAVDAHAVIVAAPAHVAADLLAPLDARAAELCRAVPYVSTASVALAWPRSSIRHPLAGSGFVVARRHNDVRITACSWVSSKWDGRAPAGQALLRAFIGGAHDPDAVVLSDDQLIDTVTRELAAILQIDDPPTLARVYRWPRAGAQHIVGHHARVQEIEARLGALPGLFVAGSGFRAIGVPDCVADGRATAAAAAHYVKMK
jgi:oxygen-dependent protoporphyrinogen oxidase